MSQVLAQFQFKMILYKEISHGVNQICSGHHFLAILVSPWFPEDFPKENRFQTGTVSSIVLYWNSTFNPG